MIDRYSVTLRCNATQREILYVAIRAFGHMIEWRRAIDVDVHALS
jgi:hypothetical protein